ncbi:AI-2E family transporter [Pelagicoccus sp. SDUM812002]|uniref:AI-2E family transporter n=1 Tax=Pelagicoccus sp. SDUM812002 TaxID=3041266 RepID=UPI00280FB358|nr:AI-2E family transporter [Pelagicoccus sp. SDUM812002]MDQ8186764.1 AI-2E family transporter [Pelagicoccus sp. SDUM812002]
MRDSIKSSGDIDASNVAKTTMIVASISALVLLLGYLFVAALHYFLLLFAGVLIASFWTGMARWIVAKTGWPHLVSLTLAVLGCFAVLVGIFWYLGPAISGQFDQLFERLPSMLDTVEGKFREYEWSRELVNMVANGEGMSETPQKIAMQALGFVGTTFGFLVDSVLVIALALFISANPKMYRDGLALLFPKRNRSRISHALNASSYTLFMWLVGRIVDMTILGVATGIGLWALGFDLALALAMLTALLCFIPNIGPVLSVVPPALVAVSNPELQVWWVLVLYVVIQVLESNLLTPLIQEKAVEMPPALLLVMQVVFAAVLGGLGLMLATPIVAVALVLVKMLYVEDVLGERLEPKGELETNP